MTYSIHSLLSSFFELCKEHFQFLQNDNDFSHIEGMVNYVQGRKFITTYTGEQDLPEDLRAIWAVSRFEKDDLAIEIGYGDADFRLSAHIYYGPAFRTELYDFLDINGVAVDLSPHQWIKSQDLLKTCIKDTAEIIQYNKRFVLKTNNKIIEKIQMKRSQEIRETIRAQHQDVLKSLTLMSTKALQNKDYKRVIELLRPYKKYLSDTDLNKLEQAQALILRG